MSLKQNENIDTSRLFSVTIDGVHEFLDHPSFVHGFAKGELGVKRCILRYKCIRESV